MMDINNPHDDAELTTATDEELDAASGGTGGNGDGFIVGTEGGDQGVIA